MCYIQHSQLSLAQKLIIQHITISASSIWIYSVEYMSIFLIVLDQLKKWLSTKRVFVTNKTFEIFGFRDL